MLNFTAKLVNARYVHLSQNG